MRFEIELATKRLIFDSGLHGLMIRGTEYLSGREGILIYDQTRDLRADEAELQMSTNTSTLIPALRVLGIPYHPYFDERPVVESQNDITFYWKPSRLAAFYNSFSTDELDYGERAVPLSFVSGPKICRNIQDDPFLIGIYRRRNPIKSVPFRHVGKPMKLSCSVRQSQ